MIWIGTEILQKVRNPSDRLGSSSYNLRRSASSRVMLHIEDDDDIDKNFNNNNRIKFDEFKSF